MSKMNNYVFYPKKNLIPLNKEGKPLFNTKKAFYKHINELTLEHLGLFNVSKEKIVNYKKLVLACDTRPDWGGWKTDRTRKFKVHTGIYKWTYDNYIYLDIDTTKISLNTVLRDFKIKKNSHAFVINYFGRKGSTLLPLIKKKIYALPIKEVYSLINRKEIILSKYKGNVKVLLEIPNFFKCNIEIRTLPDNKLLTLEELSPYVSQTKPIDFYKILEKLNITSIYNRVYNHNSKEEVIECKYAATNCDYKKSWILNEYIDDNTVFKHALKVLPVLIYQNEKNLFYDVNPVIKPIYDNIRQVQAENILTFFQNEICNFDKKYLTPKLINRIKQAFRYCYNNHKPLNVNLKYISNEHLLSNSEIVTIKSLILPKALEEFKEQYKDEIRQKWFNIFLNEFALEVFGQIKYDHLYSNKKYNSSNKALEYALYLDEHIKHTFISNKQFNLFIDHLKEKYKGFNIKPSYNLKYKILKAFNLAIDENYVKELFGKSITNSLKDIVKDIKDSKLNDIYIIYKLLSIIDNNIIICLKILTEDLPMLKLLDSVLDESYEKIEDGPPDEIDIEHIEWLKGQEKDFLSKIKTTSLMIAHKIAHKNDPENDSVRTPLEKLETIYQERLKRYEQWKEKNEKYLKYLNIQL